MKTALVIGGDSSGAKKAVDELTASVENTGTAATRTKAPIGDLDKAQRGAADSARDAAKATIEADQAQKSAAGSARADAAATVQLDAARRAAAASAREAAQASASAAAVQVEAASAARATTTATMILGEAQDAAALAARVLTASITEASAAQASSAAILRESTAAQNAALAVLQAIATEGREVAAVFTAITAAGVPAASAIATLGASAMQATTGAAALEREVREVAKADAELEAATRRVLQAVDEEALVLLKHNDLLEDAKRALDAGRISQDHFAKVQALATGAGDRNTRSLGQQKAGMYSLGQQTQDVGIQLSMGTDLMRVMAMQGGQLATAIDMIGVGGAGGRAAAFFAGPWGAVILTATAILGPWVMKLLEGSDAEDKAAKSGLELVDALSAQHRGTDEARKAIDEYNDAQRKKTKTDVLAREETIANARQSIVAAIAVRQKTQALLEEAAAQVEVNRVRSQAPGQRGELGTLALDQSVTAAAALQDRLKANQAEIAKNEQTLRNLLVEGSADAAKIATDRIAAINAQYDREIAIAERRARGENAYAAAIDKTRIAIERRRAADLDAEQKRQRAANAKPATVSLGNQVEAGSAAAILASAERYRGLSENRAGDRGTLRDLFKQANLNVDPQITAWCAAFVNAVLATNGLKGTGSLTARSFLGYGEATDKPNKGDIVVSRRGTGAQGHVGFYQGMDSKGNILVLGGNTGDRVGTQAVRKTDVLGFRRAPTAASSYADEAKAAANAQKAFQQDLQQVTQAYLPATAEAKKYADELARIEKLAKAYDPKDATSGLSPEQAEAARKALKDAHDKRMADLAMTPEAKAADEAKKSIDGVIASLQEELAARQALDPVQQAMVAHQAELAAMSDVEREAYEKKLTALYGQKEAYKAAEEATRAAAQAQQHFREMALDAFDAVAIGGEKAGDVIDRLAQTIASAAIEAAVLGTGPLAALLRGGGAVPGQPASAAGGAASAATLVAADATGKAVSKGVGERLEGIFGKGKAGTVLQNAGFGYTAASITGGSGIGGSLGGMIGGQVAGKLLASTLGSFAGPLGSIAGGILGGVVGKLFSGKPKEYGSSSISFSDGTASAAAGIGKGSAEREKASALGGSVADGLNAIAQQLGATLGSANVSIGYRPGHKAGAYRVDTTGAGRVTGVDAFESEAEAVAYAIRDAIADGVVQTSARVQQALKSSTDVDKAVAEAVKVQELETLMGGVTSTIDKAFADFAKTAKERVRIATTYGFDVVAIEKKNAEDRAKLAEQLATQQVGSLQRLIKEMESGSLFEGTALDRIKALNEAIAKSKADVAAGVDGAADTLADLYQQRLAASKDAYGSTSGYAADRQATLDEARAEVAKANARIVAAQTAGGTSDPALATTNSSLAAANSTLDEIADQNARVVAALEESNRLLAAASSGGSGGGSGMSLLRIAAV